MSIFGNFLTFKWQFSGGSGSEFLKFGMIFPPFPPVPQMHVVTYNARYPSIKAALGQPDGLHVISKLFYLGNVSNSFTADHPEKLTVECQKIAKNLTFFFKCQKIVFFILNCQ